jgi:thiamine-phosphate pyrophosphorylase
MSYIFPRLYPILDVSILPETDRAEFLHRLATELADVGVTLLEYRNKTGNDAEILADAAILRAALPAGQVKLILDDRADLVEQTGFDGVHVDTGDATPAAARNLLGPDRIVGTFGGGEALVDRILSEPADYFSIGAVYPTTTKQTTKPPIGPEGVRRLRRQAGPAPTLVAVGGITLATAAEILAAGATTLAVSAALFRHPNPAAEFRRWMRELG